MAGKVLKSVSWNVKVCYYNLHFKINKEGMNFAPAARFGL